MTKETDRVFERYSRRNIDFDSRYSILNPEVWRGLHEKQRVLISFLNQFISQSLTDLKVLEIGIGSGSNLLELIRLGFSPENLIGNELLPERAEMARRNLPALCKVEEGDACLLDYPKESFDIVYQSTVFTSLLDGKFQEKLAKTMWQWVKPGGGVLWYDFIYNNPKNKDVRGVPISRIKELFPEAKITVRRVTLAPPISRKVTKLHPSLYTFFNLFPFLRTHVLCYIQKTEKP
jgi:SAM-dependent methyltransferase